MMHKNFIFTKKHEWIKVLNEHTIRLGITNYAQEQLGDIVYVELFKIGKKVKKNEPIAVVESIKSVSNVYSPFDGYIKLTNNLLVDNPEIINESPYDKGWILEISTVEKINTYDFLTYNEYYNYIKSTK